MEKNNYILEYNEKQGGFHFNNSHLQEENTFGWETICKEITDLECMEFADKIHRRYPTTDWLYPLRDRQKVKYPSLELIRAEFELFRATKKVLQLRQKRKLKLIKPKK